MISHARQDALGITFLVFATDDMEDCSQFDDLLVISVVHKLCLSDSHCWGTIPGLLRMVFLFES